MDEVAGIYAREFSYLGCHVELGVAQGRILSVAFPTEPSAEAETSHDLLDRIDAYLAGEWDDFDDVTVALTTPTDERAVLERVREIPYDQEATVGQVARMTPDLDSEESDDLALVREALTTNPVPLFVPDHRVRDGPSGTPAAVEQKLRALENL